MTISYICRIGIDFETDNRDLEQVKKILNAIEQDFDITNFECSFSEINKPILRDSKL